MNGQGKTPVRGRGSAAIGGQLDRFHDSHSYAPPQTRCPACGARIFARWAPRFGDALLPRCSSCGQQSTRAACVQAARALRRAVA